MSRAPWIMLIIVVVGVVVFVVLTLREHMIQNTCLLDRSDMRRVYITLDSNFWGAQHPLYYGVFGGKRRGDGSDCVTRRSISESQYDGFYTDSP